MKGIITGLIFIIGIAAFFVFSWGGMKQGLFKSWQVVLSNLATIAIAVAIFWFTAPVGTNYVLFRSITLHFFHVIPLLLACPVIYFALYTMITRKKSALGVIILVIAALIGGGGIYLIEVTRDWQICEAYKTKKIENVIQNNPNAIPFTPQEVVFTTLLNTISGSKFTVEKDLIDAINVENGIGFMTPVTPDDWWWTLNAQNDGFVIWNDSRNIPERDRSRRIKQPFTDGEGMEWTDDIWRKIYSSDMWAEYPEIYYLNLDPAKPDHFTAVAPKIKYRLKWGCLFIPYWAGVVLIDDAGKVTTLKTEQVLADKRFENRRVFPAKLAKYLIDIQIYDQGWYWKGIYNRAGQIEVPDLPGNEEWPLYIKGDNGHNYYTIVTEPAGRSFALYRIYYIDASNGEILRKEYDVNSNLIGPVRAADYAKKIPGYIWAEQGSVLSQDKKRSGYIIINPVYLPKGDKLYWKFTITTDKFTAFVTAVVNSEDQNDVRKFETREEFERWFFAESQKIMGTDSLSQNSTNIEQALLLLRQAEQRQAETLRLLKQAQELIKQPQKAPHE